MGGTKSELNKLVDRQNVIIKEQSDIINRLFLLLMNYMTVEEADSLPEIKRINEISRLRDKINEPSF